MRARGPKTLRGFTLIELLVTLGLAAILLSLGVPAFADYIANQRARGAAQTLFTSLALARTEAIKRNADVVVTANGGEWENGWTIASAGSSLRGQEALTRIDATAATDSITYRPNGRAAAPATVTLCDDKGSDAVIERIVSVDTSGQATISLGGSC